MSATDDKMDVDVPTAGEAEEKVDEEEEEEDVSDLEDILDEANAAMNDTDKIPLLLSVIQNMEKTGPKATQLKERSVYDLMRAYCSTSKYDAIVSFLGDHEDTFLATITKAKTAKVVRQMLDIVCQSDTTSTEQQETVARSILEWTIAQKRSFLRQRVQAKLATILYHQHNYAQSLSMVEALLVELKKLDDKQLLVETHLLESQLYYAVSNLPKAKAALTASRTAANSIYVATDLQATMDRQAGTIHTADKDYTTAYSYFLEAFEQLDATAGSSNSASTLATRQQSLKYMMLCKILHALQKSTGGVVVIDTLLTAQQAVRYAGPSVDSLNAVAEATANRSVQELEAAVAKYPTELQEDRLIQNHMGLLKEQLLESNILRILQPYSCVEIAHVAELMELPVAETERKLSQMILDEKLNGILDQSCGQLHVLEEPDTASAEALGQGLQIVQNLDAVVTSLFERRKALGSVV